MEMSYADLYAQLHKAEMHITYLEECIKAASTGYVTNPTDYRQQSLAIKYLQNKTCGKQETDSEKGYVL